MNNQYQVVPSRLGAGRYTMTVTAIQENVRKFKGNKFPGDTYRHDIYFVDTDGVQYMCEYLTGAPYQRDFIMGETCCFEMVNPAMNEIIKCKDVPPLIASKPEEPADDLFGVKVSGTTHALALAFAKDIAVARIRMGHSMGEEEYFIKEILTHAWKFNEWLLDPQEPLPF